MTKRKYLSTLNLCRFPETGRHRHLRAPTQLGTQSWQVPIRKSLPSNIGRLKQYRYYQKTVGNSIQFINIIAELSGAKSILLRLSSLRSIIGSVTQRFGSIRNQYYYYFRRSALCCLPLEPQKRSERVSEVITDKMGANHSDNIQLVAQRVIYAYVEFHRLRTKQRQIYRLWPPATQLDRDRTRYCRQPLGICQRTNTGSPPYWHWQPRLSASACE